MHIYRCYFCFNQGPRLTSNVLLVVCWLKRVQGPKTLAESQHTVAIRLHNMPLQEIDLEAHFAKLTMYFSQKWCFDLTVEICYWPW